MNGPKWKLADLLLLILLVALALGLHRGFWKPYPNPNARPFLSTYLVLLTTASLGAFRARPAWRRPSQGYALFGWCQLVFVLRGGFDLSTMARAEDLVEGAQLGVALSLVAALLAYRFLEPPAARGDITRQP